MQIAAHQSILSAIPRPGAVRPGAVPPGPVQPEPVRPGTLRSEMVDRPGPARPEPVRPGTVRPGTARPEIIDRPGPVGLERLERLVDPGLKPKAHLDSVSAEQAPHKSPESAPQPGGITQEQQEFLLGLLGAWGQADSKYDLNGDGTVDVADLLAHLEAMQEQLNQHP